MHLVKSTAVTAAAAAGLAAVAVAVPAGTVWAATVPYRSWTQAAGNVAGISFSPGGDRFSIWDNVRDGYGAYGYVSYRTGTRTCPSSAGSARAYRVLGPVTDRSVRFSFNVREHTQVCFFVEGHRGTRYYKSPVVRYRTS